MYTPWDKVCQFSRKIFAKISGKSSFELRLFMQTSQISRETGPKNFYAYLAPWFKSNSNWELVKTKGVAKCRCVSTFNFMILLRKVALLQNRVEQPPTKLGLFINYVGRNLRFLNSPPLSLLDQFTTWAYVVKFWLTPPATSKYLFAFQRSLWMVHPISYFSSEMPFSKSPDLKMSYICVEVDLWGHPPTES